MDKDYLIRLIAEYNPQLRGEAIAVPEFRRDLYTEILEWMGRKEAIAIVGLRRTGKTTIMRQLMKDLGRDALFFSFDEEETQNRETLTFIIDYALHVTGATHLFLDEIQYVSDWEGVLKRYYDQREVKCIVSGSESLELSRSKAALAGRIISFRLDPLSFGEYLRMKGIAIEKDPPSPEDYPAMEAVYLRHVAGKELLEHEFLEYLFKGAFPELVHEENPEVIRRYIQELVVKKIIYRDIPAIFEIRRRDLLYELFRYSCANSAGLYDIRKLCTILNANYETVSNYLFYLKVAFLVTSAESYSGSPATRLRRNKKIYVVHPSIALAVLGMERGMLTDEILGQFVETIFAGRYFWRDKQKREVDVVHDIGHLLPLEVKYRNRIGREDLIGLLAFMGKFRVDRGIVVTKDTLDRRILPAGEILFYPCWLFLLGRRISTPPLAHWSKFHGEASDMKKGMGKAGAFHRWQSREYPRSPSG